MLDPRTIHHTCPVWSASGLLHSLVPLKQRSCAITCRTGSAGAGADEVAASVVTSMRPACKWAISTSRIPTLHGKQKEVGCWHKLQDKRLDVMQPAHIIAIWEATNSCRYMPGRRVGVQKLHLTYAACPHVMSVMEVSFGGQVTASKTTKRALTYSDSRSYGSDTWQ